MDWKLRTEICQFLSSAVAINSKLRVLKTSFYVRTCYNIKINWNHHPSPQKGNSSKINFKLFTVLKDNHYLRNLRMKLHGYELRYKTFSDSVENHLHNIVYYVLQDPRHCIFLISTIKFYVLKVVVKLTEIHTTMHGYATHHVSKTLFYCSTILEINSHLLFFFFKLLQKLTRHSCVLVQGCRTCNHNNRTRPHRRL